MSRIQPPEAIVRVGSDAKSLRAVQAPGPQDDHESSMTRGAREGHNTRNARIAVRIKMGT